jgi:spermidine synthase
MNKSFILKACLFVTGLAGIVTEYTLSTFATYFLGNSVLQWSLIVSFMLFAMGLGARVSRYLENKLAASFVYTEIALSMVIGFTPILVLFAYPVLHSIDWLIYLLALLIGALIGLEIPLAVRINDHYENLKTNISQILEKDYWGALLGGALFAFVFLPYLGIEKIPSFLAVLNLLVAILLFVVYREDVLRESRRLPYILGLAMLANIVSIFATTPVYNWAEQMRYRDRVIFATQTPYQKIVMTQFRDDYWLFLNGNEQFSTVDEERYHETIVHAPIVKSGIYPGNVLVLGGGDGLAVRELLKYNDLQKITLVELDREMVRLSREHPVLRKLNKNALADSRVSIVIKDAWVFLERDTSYYDMIICDFPDSKTPELARLYSYEFYQMATHRMRPNSVLITQSGSPFYSTKAMASIWKTVASTQKGTTHAMQLEMPTLGIWGFIMLIQNGQLPLPAIPVPTGYLTDEGVARLFIFNKGELPDTSAVEINTLSNPILERYYRQGKWELY